MDTLKRKMTRLKKIVVTSRSRGKRNRYTGEVRAMVCELVSEGASIGSVSSSTGITSTSIRKWLRSGGSPVDEQRFRSVSVVEPRTYEVVFPNGMKVKGLTLKQVMEMAQSASAA